MQTQKVKKEKSFIRRNPGGAASCPSAAFRTKTLQPNVSFPAAMIQTKLTMGSPSNRYEAEADAIARQVVHSLSSSKENSRASVSRISPLAKTRRAGLNFGSANEIRRAKAGGAFISRSLRAPMEKAFGADFTGVRVHRNASADRLNRLFNSRACTTGRNIFFRSGEYNPASRSGKALIAHELAHVVQQTGPEGSAHSAAAAGSAGGVPVLQRKIRYDYKAKTAVLQNIGVKKRIEQLLNKSDKAMIKKVDELFLAGGVGTEEEIVAGYNYNADTLDVEVVGFTDKLSAIIKTLKQGANAEFGNQRLGQKKGLFWMDKVG